jgi:EmrB/QacA subfamily drug resistance transporter
VLAALLLPTLTFSMFHTMVAPALPAIAREFHTTPTAASWVMTAYLLSAAVCTPLVGKFGDLFGRGRVLIVILCVFSIGSGICAIASSVEMVIAGRVVQGVAGGIFPLAFGVVNEELPVGKRAMGMGLISAMFGIGGAIGLPLAGVIVDHGQLPWLFMVGSISLAGAAAVWWVIPRSPARRGVTVDWAGAALLSAGMTLLLVGISNANEWGWRSATVLGLICAGLVTLAAFVACELRVRDPLVDIHKLAERAVVATNVASFFVGMGMFGSFILIPQFAQGPAELGSGLGLSVTASGLVMVPSAVLMLVASPVAGVLGARFGFRAVLAVGSLFIAASFGVLAAAHGSAGEVVFAGALVGIGISLAFTSMPNLLVELVDPADIGIATGINTIMRAVAGAFVSALIAALLAADVIPGTTLHTERAFTSAFALIGLSGLLAAVAALMIPAHVHRAA